MNALAEHVELELIRFSDESAAVVDLAEWRPRLHYITGPGVGEGLSEDLLRTLGVPVGRRRELLRRELSTLRVSSSLGNCSQGTPESVVVESDLAAEDTSRRLLTALERSRMSCKSYTLRASSPMDVDACGGLVRALYAAGMYRVRVVFTDADLADAPSCLKMMHRLSDELWSVLPELRVSWTCAATSVFGDVRWHDLAARVALSDYADAPPASVWRSADYPRIQVDELTVPRADKLGAAVAWLTESYRQDLVPNVESCDPYATVSASFRTARIFVPACVRRQRRQVLMSKDGRITCCPRFAPLENWRDALRGSRYWDCAVATTRAAVAGCCNGARLMRRTCRGAPDETCPTAACSTGSALAPALLTRLFDSLVQPPALECPAATAAPSVA